MHAATLTDPTVESNHPTQNFIAAAAALVSGLKTRTVDQCPLTLLSGLVPCLLFGLELVLSSPCVIFSMKLM